MGLYRPPAHLVDHFSLTTPQTPVKYYELVEDRIANLSRLAQLPTEKQPIVALYGADRIGRYATAEALAASVQRKLLTVTLDKIVGETCTPLKAIRMGLRDARLTGAIPHLTGWESCLRNQEAAEPELMAELSAHPGLVIVTSPQHWWAEGSTRTRAICWEHYALPTYGQRRKRWDFFLAEFGGDLRVSVRDDELEHLAGQFVLTGDQIRDAVATARDTALQELPATGECVLCGDDLFRSARQHSGLKLSSLARKINPHFGWGDLILPSEPLAVLHELVGAIRERPTVLEQWGVARKLAPSRGITALFTGPPGTGKTMAADVIAGELNLDLYKIDLSSVVSKYIGETEKNLERIFSEATTSNAILFFDEADAIFGKRSEVKDAHDRYANIEISYLLQRMEAYDGVTILATNLRANLDEAFARRLQFAVDFPFPQAGDRLRIWETLFPDDVPLVEGLNFSLLSRRFELAGGNIRNIIINAAYLAATDGGKVTMAHLLHSTRRELQKIGRLFGEDEFTI